MGSLFSKKRIKLINEPTVVVTNIKFETNFISKQHDKYVCSIYYKALCIDSVNDIAVGLIYGEFIFFGIYEVNFDTIINSNEIKQNIIEYIRKKLIISKKQKFKFHCVYDDNWCKTSTANTNNYLLLFKM